MATSLAASLLASDNIHEYDDLVQLAAFDSFADPELPATPSLVSTGSLPAPIPAGEAVHAAAEHLRALPRASVLNDAVDVDLVNRVYSGLVAHSPRRGGAHGHGSATASPPTASARQSLFISPPLPDAGGCGLVVPPEGGPLLFSPAPHSVATAGWAPGDPVTPARTPDPPAPTAALTYDPAAREVSPRRPAHASTGAAPHRDPVHAFHTTDRTVDAIALSERRARDGAGAAAAAEASPYREDQEGFILRRALEDARKEVETLREEARLGQGIAKRYKQKAEGLAVRLQQAAEGAEIWKHRVDEMVAERSELQQGRGLLEAKLERVTTEMKIVLIEREKTREMVGSLAEVERQREEIRERERALDIKSAVQDGLWEKAQRAEEQLAACTRASREKDTTITELQAALVLRHTDAAAAASPARAANAAGGILSLDEETRLARSHHAALREVLFLRESEERVRLETARALFVSELRHLATAADAERYRTLYEQERGVNKQEFSDKLASVGEAKARAEAVAKQLDGQRHDLERQLAAVTSKYLYGAELSESELECLREQNRLLRTHVDRSQERLLTKENELTKAHQKISELRDDLFNKEDDAERFRVAQHAEASPSAATATPPSYRATPQSLPAANPASSRRRDVCPRRATPSPNSRIKVVSVTGPNQSVTASAGKMFSKSGDRQSATPRSETRSATATPRKPWDMRPPSSRTTPAPRTPLKAVPAKTSSRRTATADRPSSRSASTGGTHWIHPPGRSSPTRNRSASPRRVSKSPGHTGARVAGDAASSDAELEWTVTAVDAGDEHTPGATTSVQRVPDGDLGKQQAHPQPISLSFTGEDP